MFGKRNPNQSNMPTYYINTNPNQTGKYEVHTSDCTFLLSFLNRKYLGDFKSCSDAIKKAEETFDTVKACRNCNAEYHTN
jgi:hypothetical protein